MGEKSNICQFTVIICGDGKCMTFLAQSTYTRLQFPWDGLVITVRTLIVHL